MCVCVCMQLYLSSLQVVMQSVTISDSTSLVSLSFLRNLRSAGSVYVTNNNNLIDARLPSLYSGVSGVFGGEGEGWGVS